MAKQQTEETIVDVREVQSKTEQFIDKNRAPLFGFLGVLVLAIVGYYAYQNFVVKPKMAEATNEMWFSENAVLLQDSVDLAISGNGLYKGLEEIAQDYEGTIQGEKANYLLGIAYRTKGEFQTALDYFKQADLDEPNVAAIIQGNIGDMNVELGNMAEALPSFEKAATITENGEIKSIYLMKAAMVAKNQGDNAKAAKLLGKIVNDIKDATNYRDAVKQLAALPAS